MEQLNPQESAGLGVQTCKSVLPAPICTFEFADVTPPQTCCVLPKPCVRRPFHYRRNLRGKAEAMLNRPAGLLIIQQLDCEGKDMLQW